MKNKILVVSHDAGGANILASLIQKYKKDFSWISLAYGPAKNIFLKKKISFFSPENNKSIKKILKSIYPSLLLTGTSGGSKIEINFIKTAKEYHIKTAVFLDHWANFKERFGYPGIWKKNLTDYIFVGDKWAYDVALKNQFPKKILLQVENPYFEEIIEQVEDIKKKKKSSCKEQSNKLKILYLSEPTYQKISVRNNNAQCGKNVEDKIIEDLLKIMKCQNKVIMSQLKIRLHPAEKPAKYNNLLSKKEYFKIKKNISVSNPVKNLLIKDCLWADIVIGYNSMALFIAFMIGKKAIAYLPNKQSFTLPAKEILKVHSLTELEDKIIFSKDNLIKSGKKTMFNLKENFKNVFYKKIVMLKDG